MVRPCRPQPPWRRSGSLAFGITLALAAAGLDRAWGSSPQAWGVHGQTVQRACLAASRLRNPRPAGERLDLPGSTAASTAAGPISVLLIRGTYPQPHMAGRSGLELCLYDAASRQVRIGDADRLDQRQGQSPGPRP